MVKHNVLVHVRRKSESKEHTCLQLCGFFFTQTEIYIMASVGSVSLLEQGRLIPASSVKNKAFKVLAYTFC